MGCNCKATEKILNIHKKYGKEMPLPLGEKIKFRTEEIIKMVIVFLLALIASPIILIVLLVLAFQGKTVININKILYKVLKKDKNE